MTPEEAKAGMQFMLRAELRGQEVPAFNTVMQALSEISNPAPLAGTDQDGQTDKQQLHALTPGAADA